MASERLQRQIGLLLDEAEEALTYDDWALVSDRAEKVLLLEPNNADALAFLAAAERAQVGPGQSAATGATAPTGPAPQEPRAEPTSFAAGRYQIKELLGEGGRKRVYAAHDGVLDRDVALAVIKTEGLDEASRVRITREAQAMGRLGDHPNILQIHDLADENGQPYIVLPLTPGGDVEALIDQAPEHRVPIERAVNIATDVCRGLEHAHSMGIVHRDLKPGNVWLAGDGSARIGDFGLAVAADLSRLTQEGVMVGTPLYMPPEQALGSEVTPQADLYSLGAMLYEMVTGRPPFVGDTLEAVIGQHINTSPVAPTWHNPSCPRPLEALIVRLLAKDPSGRPQSAADVLTALEGIDVSAADVGAAGGPPSASEDTNVLDSLAGGVFVGRQREMGELKASLEEALSGRGRMVTLVGEPGIGKTRTALELETYAGLRGVQTLWGRCYEDVGAPPYWPWVQAIRSYVRERDPDKLRSEMGTGATDIAEIVSDVRERLPDLKPSPALEDPEQARFRLFDSIAAFLKNASQSQPLVLILDDLHWADKPSLMLLEFVARELSGARLLLVGTYRDVELSRRHPLAQTLGELTRERLFQRVLLRGLSEDDVAQFIELTSGVEAPAGLVRAVYTQTEGNPLFVTEVVRLLVQEGQLGQTVSGVGAHGVRPDVGADLGVRPSPGDRESWTIRIPEGVREVIGRRLDRLSERCNETLTIASVIGRQFELAQLSRLVEDMSEDRLLEVLEEALAARVIEELPTQVGRYEFTHALIQETLAEELSLTRRVRLHARIAETLEELYGDTAEANAAELAHHYGQAEAVLGTDKLVRYSLLAGERAQGAYGYEEALSHFERALAAKEGQPPDGETAALWYGIGRAQVFALPRLRAQEALDNLIRAFDYYAEAPDVPQALAVAQTWFTGDHMLTGLKEMLLRALELVSPDSGVAARLLARYGRYVGVAEGDYERAQEAIERAVAIAQREDDPALEMWTLINASSVEVFHLHHQEVLKRAVRVIELARELGEPVIEGYGHSHAFGALVALGDPEAASLHADELVRLGEMVRSRRPRATLPHAELSRLQGDWQDARRFYDQALAGETFRTSYVARALLEYETGDFSQGEAFLDCAGDAVGAPRNQSGVLLPLEMLIARIAGVERPTEVLENNARALVSGQHNRSIKVAARAGLGLTAVLRGDAQEAAEHYRAVEPQRGTMIGYFGMSADRILGLLAYTIGRPDDAGGHFEHALAFCRKAGYRPELAWTCHDYADALLHPGRGPGASGRTARAKAGDREKAMALLDEGVSIARELGMRPLVERMESLKEQAEAQPATAPAYPDGLTQREVEVLRLVAEGKTNREIAEELFISLRTVANHVTNILSKTGAANRAQAATYANQKALLKLGE